MTDPKFSGQFIGKNPESYKLTVKKDGGDVDAITAATISSRAYCDAVDRASKAFGNEVKSPNDVEKAINKAEKFPKILSLLVICEDKIGIRGDFEIRILK